MRRLIRNEKRINRKAEVAIEELERDMNSQARWMAIQSLIPLGLEAVKSALQAEVISLVGHRHSRGGDLKRWGQNPGSVFIGDQKMRVKVPRVRDTYKNTEVPLESYGYLQDPRVIDDVVLSRVIRGISHRDYEYAAMRVPETFGIKKTSICRRFIRASAKKLREFMERDLSGLDIVAIFIDGKTFSENQIVIALGVTIEGRKVLLGFVETSTENHSVCRQFLNGLVDRGLNLEKEVLFILDGGKGLHKGVKEVMGERAVIQRCQWHKRENVVSHLDAKDKQEQFRRKLQAAYDLPTYEKAKTRLKAIGNELRFINESALHSLEEGLEETLTLHRLGLFAKLGESFKTTNCIENVNKLLAKHTDRVDRWHNSNQRRRWVATAMLIIEPSLRTVKGHDHLWELRAAMETVVVKRLEQKDERKAA